MDLGRIESTDQKSPRQIMSFQNLDNSEMMKNRQSHLERILLLIENKKATEIFKRKVKVIKRHFNNRQHPLRMLTDLFGDELQRI